MQIKFDANKKRLDTTPAFGLLVQGENLAESIQITGPKMVGALDLSQLRVAVRMTSQQYETTVEKTLEQTTDGDTITFTWQVDKQFTGSPGKVDVMLVGYGGNEEVIKITSSGMVVQEDKTFNTAPPESTWEQILQQMQDFATQAYESKTAAENSAAEAAASQKVAEEKAAQATNAASEAVKAAETAAADAAAQAAAKTEQQIRQYADDRYARPLVTKTGPAASLEVYPDKQSNLKVYANGFTQQAGSGDPSPTNVRAITNGGIVLNKTVFNGSENWMLGGGGIGETPYFFLNGAYSGDVVSSSLYSERYPGVSIFKTNSVQGIGGYKTTCYLRDSKYDTVDDFKAALQANPLLVWYATTDGTGTLYASIVLEGGEYRATCLPLTAPLCEGDSVVSWARSGCDKAITFDGSEDEKWETYQNSFVIWGVFANSVPMSPSDKSENIYTNILYQQSPDSSGQHAVGTFYAVNNPTSGNFIVVNLNGDTDISAFRAALAAHPLTVWYRSTNYTEAADIPVSLETHQRAVLVLDGTEGWATAVAGAYYMFPSNLPKAFAATSATSAVSDYLTAEPTNDIAAGTEGFGIGPSGSIAVRLPNGAAPSAYMPNKPLTVVYQLANPITYAHPAVELPALPDDTGKVTITGQSGGTVTVVFNKSIIKEIAEIKAAMLAMGANLSM